MVSGPARDGENLTGLRPTATPAAAAKAITHVWCDSDIC